MDKLIQSGSRRQPYKADEIPTFIRYERKLIYFEQWRKTSRNDQLFIVYFLKVESSSETSRNRIVESLLVMEEVWDWDSQKTDMAISLSLSNTFSPHFSSMHHWMFATREWQPCNPCYNTSRKFEGFEEKITGEDQHSQKNHTCSHINIRERTFLYTHIGTYNHTN